MLLVYIFVLLFTLINGFEPSCLTCKHFIPNKANPEYGLCNMFQDVVYNRDEKNYVKNFAVHCRNNESQCGKSGFLYEPINNCKVCSDNDLKELEQLEKDFVDVFQKMRRHNTKMIYRTPRELYKLFKKPKSQ